MSYSLEKIRRKSDGVVLYDYIFDACDTHNIYDEDLNLIIQDHGFNIGYEEGRGWIDGVDYENVPFDSDEEYWNIWNSIKKYKYNV